MQFQKPRDGWLCFLSLVWFVGGMGFGIRHLVAGNHLLAAVHLLLGTLGGALWFRSKAAAWVMIVLAVIGSVNALIHIGQWPWLRLVARLAFALMSISLLWAYLKEQDDD